MLAYSPAGRGEERGEREERERREDQPTPSPSLCPKVHNPGTGRRRGRCTGTQASEKAPGVPATRPHAPAGTQAWAHAPRARTRPHAPVRGGPPGRERAVVDVDQPTGEFSPPKKDCPATSMLRWWVFYQLGVRRGVQRRVSCDKLYLLWSVCYIANGLW
jgi:hypothetical protein